MKPMFLATTRAPGGWGRITVLVVFGCLLLLVMGESEAYAQSCICQAGAQRCNGNVIEKCDVNCQRWYSFQTCGSGQLCVSGQCKACNCSPGQTRCVGDDVQTCQSDCTTWTQTSTCSVASGTFCGSGQCKNCACTPGSKKCVGPDVYECRSNCSGWTKTSTCAAGLLCLGGTCSNCKCVAGTTRCAGQQIEQCDAACQGWQATSTCPTSTKCVSYNGTTSCQAPTWCPYTTATLTPICNNKICVNGACQPAWDCADDSHCAQGLVCVNNQCKSASCSYSNSTGVFDVNCEKNATTKAYCALQQCRDCRYDHTVGQIAPECQKHHSGREYCAKYQCVQCPHDGFTAFAGCQTFNADLKYCREYKCVQCPHASNPSDTQYCGGKPCINYKCASCSNGTSTPKVDSQCSSANANTPYCKNNTCVECAETNSLSSICKSKYTNKPFCNSNNQCVQCSGSGTSGLCQSQYSRKYCFGGFCRECSAAGTKANDSDCVARTGGSRPHCLQYSCVACTNSSGVGAYDEPMCASKYGSVAGDKRYCARNQCVQCPHAAAQKSPACPAGKPVCAGYTCHECASNGDCPVGQACVNGQCKKTAEECGRCQTDAWCQQNATSGANCGAGKSRCNPRNNTCVRCLIDSDCASGQTCDLVTNTCASGRCPGFCLTNADCQLSDCGTNTACVKNRCTKPSTSFVCAPPNIVLVTDRSCSMRSTGTSALVDTKQPCSAVSDCTAYFGSLVPSYSPHYTVSCINSPSVGANTCWATRWDVAMAALRKVVHDFGGTSANAYNDRKVRWGKIFFDSAAAILGGNTAPTNLANWGGLSDVPNTPYLISQMQSLLSDGGTNYTNAFSLVETHLTAAFAADSSPNRKTAIVFTTDGAPNEGCDSSPPIVDRIYKMKTASGDDRKIKTYIVGFGSGLGTTGEACLDKLAVQGRTNTQKCTSGRCLTFYAADSAADLANALQDIVNQATKEECDGLDNDCDGLVDNNTTDACSCIMSYTRPTPTSAVDPQAADYRVGVRLYTFVASFDRLGTCPTPDSQDDKDRKLYMEACRNQASQATACSPGKSSQPQPAGDAYSFYAARCCGNGSTSGTCSWPTSHACQSKPWGGVCETALTNFCKAKKSIALNCAMPKGTLVRSGTGYDPSGELTVLTVTDFGADRLDRQTRRNIFVHMPDKDYRTTNADSRPLIANITPDEYASPTSGGSSFGSITSIHQFSPANLALTAQRLGIDTTKCTAADCNLDREELIWFVLGYDGSGNVTRKSRLGAIYHSTPQVRGAVRASSPDPGFAQWIQQTIPAGGFTNKTVQDRPAVLYVGTADGIMHAFSVYSGMELWGYIPKYFLQSGARDTLREGLNGVRADGSRAHLVDGSPVVEDVQMYRRVLSTGNIIAKWRTVLLFGLRAGGRAYVAIDVTNPYKPRLLWEITPDSYKNPNNTSLGKFDNLGLTYGQPLISNVLINFQGVLQERAIAFLPGGIALKRTNQTKPWELDYNSTTGSVVYAVDLETGQYLTALSTKHNTADCSGNVVSIERGVAAAPVASGALPAPVSRIFFGDILGNLFRVQLNDPNPSNWTVDAFFSVFRPCEQARPIMTAPSVAYNAKGELVLFGGTGDIENLDEVVGHNKIYSVREVSSLDSNGLPVIEALPNFIFKLNKMLGTPLGDEVTKALGSEDPQVTSGSYTGERITGPAVVFGGTAYFTTYLTQARTPVCGVKGFARIYGIHFSDGCRTDNCYPLATGSASSGIQHHYLKVAGYVHQGGGLSVSRTPIRACESDGAFNSGLSEPPTDAQVRNNEALNKDTCGDLEFTVPMLPNTSNVAPFEFYRYQPLGENTLVMGLTFSYQPTETTTSAIRHSTTGGFAGHQLKTTKPGRSFLSFQVAGNSPSVNNKWRLQKLRAVQIPAMSRMKGAFSTLGTANAPAPVSITSWGRILD